MVEQHHADDEQHPNVALQTDEEGHWLVVDGDEKHLTAAQVRAVRRCLNTTSGL